MVKLRPGLEKVTAYCRDKLLRESRRAGQFIEANIRRLMALWVALTALGGLAKILQLVGRHPRAASLEQLAPLGLGYGLAAIAPVIGYLLVQKCFPRGRVHPQPKIRLARLGRWSDLDPQQVIGRQGAGLSGLNVSVVAGLLLCLVMRLGEYYLAVPAIPAAVSGWAATFYWMMTLDLAFLAFLYSVAIAMALNSAPLFPRMLAYAWFCDVLMQLAIARAMVNAGPLPAEIVAPLQAFLVINIKKVMISASLWLPYLLLSANINATFRHRIRVSGPLLLRLA